jgi:hypothetical protein
VHGLWIKLIPALALLTLIVGCGRGPRLKSTQANFTLDGKPLGDASVQLKYAEYPRTAGGRTDSDGKCTFVYYNRAGAPLGQGKVMVSKRGPDGREMIPAKYNSNTQLQIEITSRGSNEFSFDLSSEKDGGRTQVPGAQNRPTVDADNPDADNPDAPSNEGSRPGRDNPRPDDDGGRDSSDDG